MIQVDDLESHAAPLTRAATWQSTDRTASLPHDMGSLIKKRRKRMRKKKHKKMLKATRWQRRAGK
jgi:mRNA-processing protein COX24